jgi:hypothetical protein
MIVPNLYADHLGHRLDNHDSLLLNVYAEPREYRQAARELGLTDREYLEFKRKLLQGQAVHVELPARLSAMTGKREGRVYVLNNIQLADRTMGYRVTLADGKVVYAPDSCGNLSVVNPKYYHSKPVVYVPQIRNLTPATAHTVTMAPPPLIVSVEPVQDVPAAVVPVAGAPVQNNTGIYACRK